MEANQRIFAQGKMTVEISYHDIESRVHKGCYIHSFRKINSPLVENKCTRNHMIMNIQFLYENGENFYRQRVWQA